MGPCNIHKRHTLRIAMGITALVMLMTGGMVISSAASANLIWKGMTRDIVGSGGSPNFDYNPDGYFTLSIDLGQETKIVDYISLKSVDANNNPTGDAWDTDPNTNYWRLAVEQPLGMLLNPTDTLIRKTISGNTAFELYAANNGKFVLGNYFNATVRFTDGTSIDATTPIFEIPREFPINLKWNGLISDKVGSVGNPNPDKNPDGYFTLSIDLGQETKIVDYISLKSVDARNNPTGDAWDTDPNTNYWRLAVEQPLGMLLNPTDTLIRKTISGNTAFELYAANNGKFVLGNYFKATIRFTDGTLIDATETIEDTNQTITNKTSATATEIKINTIPSTTQTPTTTAILVTSFPSGAKVYIGGIYKGITPIKLSDLPQGSPTVKLMFEGYKDWQQNIDIASRETTYFPVVLEPSTIQSCDYSDTFFFSYTSQYW